MPAPHALSEKRQNRMKILTGMREFNEKIVARPPESRSYTGEEETAFEKMKKEYSDLGIEIEKEEKEEQRSRFLQTESEYMNKPKSRMVPETINRDSPIEEMRCRWNDPETRSKLRCREYPNRNSVIPIPIDFEAVSERMQKFNDYLGYGSINERVTAVQEYRALQVDVPTQAGYLVSPELFVAELIKNVDNLSVIRQKARRFTLERAKSLGFPQLTADPSTCAWTGEIVAPSADSTMAVGKREFKPNVLSGYILVSKTLLRSGALSVDELVRERLAYHKATFEEQAFMTGDGAARPLGLFTASANGINTDRDVSTHNTATEIKDKNLITCKWKIKSQYWPNLTWLFHRDGCLQINLLQDGMGQYIWRESVRAGEPAMLFGVPVILSEYCPATFTAGQYVGLIGDLSKYWIVDTLDFEIQVLVELYALTNQVCYLFRAECDGAPVINEAFSRVKLAA